MKIPCVTPAPFVVGLSPTRLVTVLPRGGHAMGWLSVPLLRLTATVLVALAPTRPSDAADVGDDRQISVGRWDVVAVEWDGTSLDKEWLARLHVIYRADGSWAVLLKRLPVAEGRSTIRQDATPKTFEMETLGSEGIQPSRFQGIYRLDGDTRVLCIVREGAPRPDEFSAPRGSGRMLVTLQRARDSSGCGQPAPTHP